MIKIFRFFSFPLPHTSTLHLLRNSFQVKLHEHDGIIKPCILHATTFEQKRRFLSGEIVQAYTFILHIKNCAMLVLIRKWCVFCSLLFRHKTDINSYLLRPHYWRSDFCNLTFYDSQRLLRYSKTLANTSRCTKIVA